MKCSPNSINLSPGNARPFESSFLINTLFQAERLFGETQTTPAKNLALNSQTRVNGQGPEMNYLT
jgi:hypothetical protein